MLNRVFLLCASMILLGCAACSKYSAGGAAIYSDIKNDEYVVFFRTTAWLDESSQEWHVPIHGWIYEPEDSVARKEIFSATLENQYGLVTNEKTKPNFTRRINLMIADNERDKQIVVAVAGRTYILPPSGVDGHFERILISPSVEVDKFAEGDLIKYSAVTRESETRTFRGETKLLTPTGLSVISDIDDTVKISNVRDRSSLLEHTFFLDFSAVPGMTELYDEWSEHAVSLHFVSSSPWQLYSPLQEFLDSNRFPWSTLSLKSVRFRDETLFNLFKEGTETKPVVIEEILNTYAGRKFVLIGDSGEQDPEVYGALVRKYPDQILKIYIRNVTGESADNERFESAFEGFDRGRWELFEDPQTLVFP